MRFCEIQNTHPSELLKTREIWNTDLSRVLTVTNAPKAAIAEVNTDNKSPTQHSYQGIGLETLRLMKLLLKTETNNSQSRI